MTDKNMIFGFCLMEIRVENIEIYCYGKCARMYMEMTIIKSILSILKFDQIDLKRK